MWGIFYFQPDPDSGLQSLSLTLTGLDCDLLYTVLRLTFHLSFSSFEMPPSHALRSRQIAAESGQ